MPKKKKQEPKTEVPCLNISVIKCWNCNHEMLVPYFSNDLMMPWGPENFSDKQLEMARTEGCQIEEMFSRTMNESYTATKCPTCGEMMGMFFYHDFAYVPGDVQIMLDQEDKVLERIINKPIQVTITPFDPNNTILARKKRKSEENAREVLKREKGKCVRVKFDNNRNYKYNCIYDVKIGDQVKVEGKMTGLTGTVVNIIGPWDYTQNMLEVESVL